MAKFIFITGGVVSGIGKGITGASLARLLKSRGYKVFMQKFDPYVNVDPGTMSPYQHGEVYVTSDGAETDLDLGHYERFLDENCSKNSNITTGLVYSNVIKKERRGSYNGATVQVVPHITAEIKNKVYDAAKDSGADIIITEIGGTSGDIESLPFVEGIRQVALEKPGDVCFIHATLVPFLRASGEYKSKPTQHSVATLRSLGIQPNIIVTRSDTAIGKEIKSKIALFCNITPENVIEAVDQETIFNVPLALHKQNMDTKVLKVLGLAEKKINLREWNTLVNRVQNLKGEVKIALVGKYVELHDAYLSVAEALRAAGYATGKKVKIDWVQAEDLNDKNVAKYLSGADGILVPGGFGNRGIEGKISAIKYARTKNIPFFGICLGMQLATIEFARNVCGLKAADSTEWNAKTETPIIDIIRGTSKDADLGGTLRLGDYVCHLEKGTLARELYGSATAIERHRHRYEFNNDYKEVLEKAGMKFSGIYKEKGLVEIIELPKHKFFIAGQFHPEFTSRPTKAQPLFLGFVKAAISHGKK